MSLPVIAAGAAWVEQLQCVTWIPGTQSSVLVWGGGGGGGRWGGADSGGRRHPALVLIFLQPLLCILAWLTLAPSKSHLITSYSGLLEGSQDPGFPRSPHCRGPGFTPWSASSVRDLDPTCSK